MTDLKNSEQADSGTGRPVASARHDQDQGRVTRPAVSETVGVAGPGAAPTERRTRRSTPFQKVLKTLIGVVSVLLVLALGTLGYTWFRIDQIPKVPIPKDPGVPAGGLPTIEIPVGGGTADGNAPTDSLPTAPAGAAGSGPASSQKPGDSIPDAGEGNLATPIATVKPIAGTKQFGPLLDTSGVTPFGGSGAKNYLMIGVDSRADIPADQKTAFGEVGGSRSDTIMLLRLNPSTNQAWVLSFPRDLYVRIAGTNQFNRLNAAYAKSAATLTSTLRENFNVPVDHFAVVDFVGFQKVVDAVGGVTICFPKASRDTKTGLDQPAGCNLLNPVQATAYVRSRHFQEGANGTWHEDPRGDLGRIQRQQAFIRAVLSQAVKKGMSDPVTFNRLLTSMRAALTLDSAFGFGDIAKLASDLHSFDPNTLQTFTVPNVPRRINGKDILLVDNAKASKVIGQFGQRKTATK
jgi:LCP family protein required for cell wall assembly